MRLTLASAVLLCVAACSSGQPVPYQAPFTVETWFVYFPDDFSIEKRGAVLTHLEAFYKDFEIDLLDGFGPPPAFYRQRPVGTANVLCVQQSGPAGIVGLALVDPGNKHSEINCGEMGVFLNEIADDPYLIALVLAHEIGHSLGLEHGMSLSEPHRIMSPVLFPDARPHSFAPASLNKLAANLR